MAREMKDSGIAWIGEIPAEWDRVKFKYLHNGLNTGESIDKDYWSTDEKDDVFYTAGLTPIRTTYKDFPPWKYTQKNDILLARNGTPYVYFPVEGACYSDHIIRASIKNSINRKFVQYALQQSIASVVVDSVSIATWSASLWDEQIIPWPNKNEQQRIVIFLDKECAYIDAVIEQTRASIEEHKKLKQSVITQAVTKGIRPNRPMKESGVDWIGTVPCDWTIQKLKNIIIAIESGVSVNAAQYPAQEGEIGVLKTSCVSKFTFLLEENKAVNQEEYDRVACPVKANTIIMSRMNTPDLVGACGYVGEDYPNLYLPDRLWQVHFSAQANVKYIWYYLNCKNVRNYYASLAVGTSSSMQNISQDQFYNTFVPIPTAEEQKEIVVYLDEKIPEIDALIDKKEKLISELESYKKSMIYEYVTGKKEVPVC